MPIGGFIYENLTPPPPAGGGIPRFPRSEPPRNHAPTLNGGAARASPSRDDAAQGAQGGIPRFPRSEPPRNHAPTLNGGAARASPSRDDAAQGAQGGGGPLTEPRPADCHCGGAAPRAKRPAGRAGGATTFLTKRLKFSPFFPHLREKGGIKAPRPSTDTSPARTYRRRTRCRLHGFQQVSSSPRSPASGFRVRWHGRPSTG